MKHFTSNKTIHLFLAILAIAMMVCTSQVLPSGQQTTAKAASSVSINPVQAAKGSTKSNPIQKENLLPGSTDWQITYRSSVDTTNNTNDLGIEGYASLTSVSAGSTISFAVSTISSSFNADIYRLGWYQGDGARLEQSITGIAGHSYSIPKPDAQTGLIQANWPSAFAVTIPSTWVSGAYLVKLTSVDGPQQYIPFVVKTTRKSDFVLVDTVNTGEAYNAWGGTSLYGDLTNTVAAGRAYKVSFDRPNILIDGSGILLYWEYPMIRWLEKNGYDVSYVTDLDISLSSKILMGHHGVLVVGHSEYWSSTMRSNVQTAVNSGVNLGAFGGNDVYWQVRYEKSATSVPNRVMTCYKDASVDPLNNKKNNLVTVQFSQSPVNNAAQALLGSMAESMNPGSGDPWVVSNASSWVFAGTNLNNGDSIPGIVGHEYDKLETYAALPATITGADGVDGVEILSSSPVLNYDNNPDISNSTLYTAPSGARVFNAGTLQWSWGLDSFTATTAFSPAIQQITANILHNFVTGAITAATTGNN